METTGRPPTPADEWQIETRNVEVPGVHDAQGQPCIATIRRLPASEVYLVAPVEDAKALQELYRRWASLAIVAPELSLNGSGPGLSWDDLPFATHEGLARQIMDFSMEGTPAARAAGAAFRGGEPARGTPGGAGGGSGGAGADAPKEPAALPAGDELDPAGGA